MTPSKDSPPPAAPKLAMKSFSLSTKPSSSSKSLSFSTKVPLAKPLSTTLGKRPRATALGRHDSDSDDDSALAVRHEEVTGFDIGAGGAVRKEATRKEGPLVIPRMKNRDWREEIRRGRGGRGKDLLPPEVRAQREGRGREEERKVEEGGEEEVKWGLTVGTKKIKKGEGEEEAQEGRGDVGENSETTVRVSPNITEEEDATHPKSAPEPAPAEKSIDQLALEALTGIQPTTTARPDLIIGPATSDACIASPPLTEEDAYRRAIRAAPDVSTLEDYERVPVEEFGAALLRGMGWKEGDAKVERPRDVKRRQNLLGLGASELKGAEELGAWVQKSDPKRLGSGERGGGERRPKANEYREREDRRREEREVKFGGGERRRDEGGYRERERERRR